MYIILCIGLQEVIALHVNGLVNMLINTNNYSMKQ